MTFLYVVGVAALAGALAGLLNKGEEGVQQNVDGTGSGDRSQSGRDQSRPGAAQQPRSRGVKRTGKQKGKGGEHQSTGNNLRGGSRDGLRREPDGTGHDSPATVGENESNEGETNNAGVQNDPQDSGNDGRGDVRSQSGESDPPDDPPPDPGQGERDG